MQQQEKDELLRRLTPQPRPIYRLLTKVIGECSTVQDVVPKLMVADPDARVCTPEELNATVEQVEYVIDNGKPLDLTLDEHTNSQQYIVRAQYSADRFLNFYCYDEIRNAFYLRHWVDNVHRYSLETNLRVAESIHEAERADDACAGSTVVLCALEQAIEPLMDASFDASSCDEPSSWEEEGWLGEDEDPVSERIKHLFVNGRMH